MFRTQNRVPEVYPKMSRDFQILCRALDLTQNGVKFDIDSITNILDTSICSNLLLPLLQMKLGFYSNRLIPDDDLRVILKAFPHIKMWKGSLLGIKLAINTYLKIRPTKVDSILCVNKKKVINSDGTIDTIDSYTINIVFADQAYDFFILDEILKFIVPPGYDIIYTYAMYEDSYEQTDLEFDDCVIITKTNGSTWSTLANTDTINLSNSVIRNIKDNLDVDSNEIFVSETRRLDIAGLVSRLRSSTNFGELCKSIDYNQVNLRSI